MLSLGYRIAWFKVQVTTVALYGCETWPAPAEEILSELTSQNVKFSRLFFGNNITA